MGIFQRTGKFFGKELGTALGKKVREDRKQEIRRQNDKAPHWGETKMFEKVKREWGDW